MILRFLILYTITIVNAQATGLAASSGSSSRMSGSSLNASGFLGSSGLTESNAVATGGDSTGGNGSAGTNGATDGQKNTALANGQMVNAALKQYTYQQMGGEGNANKIAPGIGPNGENLFCDSKGVEGNNHMMKNQMAKKCIQQAQEKKALANAIVQKQSQNKECTIKVNKQSMICHTKKVIQDMVSRPVWELKAYGNIVEIDRDGEAIVAVVDEELNYDVTKKSSPKKEALKEPNIQIKFNELGGLLSQKGELPTSKSEDPCALCIQSLNKKASTMEGGLDDCNNNCDDMMLQDFLKPGHFRMVQQAEEPPAPEPEGSKPESKPAAEPAEGA